MPLSAEDAQAATDETLARLSLKDDSAFYFLMRRYEPKILRYIQRMTRLARDACEDLLQEIFIKLFRNLNGFDSRLQFSSWAYRIAYNEIVSQYRKNKRHAELTVTLDDGEGEALLSGFLSDTTDVQTRYLSAEKHEQVDKALAQLPAMYREILILRYLEEMSYREIGDIIRKPAGTVATLINRAKSKFEKIAKRYQLDR